MRVGPRIRVLLGCVIAWASFTGSLQAVNEKSTHTQKQGKAEAVVVGENRDADQVEATLSGAVTVILRVEGGAGLEVEPVQAVNASADWKELRRDKETYTPRGADAGSRSSISNRTSQANSILPSCHSVFGKDPMTRGRRLTGSRSSST